MHYTIITNKSKLIRSCHKYGYDMRRNLKQVSKIPLAVIVV